VNQVRSSMWAALAASTQEERYARPLHASSARWWRNATQLLVPFRNACQRFVRHGQNAGSRREFQRI